MAETLAAILPPGAVCVERGAMQKTGIALAEGGIPALYPGEEELIAGASEGRRREFAEARACAREALGVLGAPAGAILATGDGAPRWPDGIVGSITHKGGYRAAAVARTEHLAGLGIDAERDERLPAGVLETIASPRELDQVEALLAERSGMPWDRLLFSAKEAVLKAAHPVGLGLAGVRTVEVELDARARTFRATPRDDASTVIRGAWSSTPGLLLCAACVSRTTAT
jgi:4'-phosphopantetheinyl transferase EntD